MSTPLLRSPKYSSNYLKFMKEFSNFEIPPVPKGYVRAKKKSSKRSNTKKKSSKRSNTKKKSSKQKRLNISLKSGSLRDMFDTPEDFYENKSSSPFVLHRDSPNFQGIFDTPEEFYENKSSSPFVLNRASSSDQGSNFMDIQPSMKPSIQEYPDGLTLEICSNYSLNEPIDLNLVRPDTNIYLPNISWGKASNEVIDSGIPGLLSYNGVSLSNISYISSGAYGSVFKYTSEEPLSDDWRELKSKSTGMKFYRNHKLGISRNERPHKYEIALKTFNNYKDPEINFVNKINSRGERGSCNIINSNIIKLRGRLKNGAILPAKNVAIMDLMDGTLRDLRSLDINDKIQVIKRLAEHLLCLKNMEISDHNLSYTDLKEGNILYKCFPNNKMKIVIGDIGSICDDPRKRGAGTYPSPESLMKFEPNCDEGTMVWGLGVTFLEMLGYDTMGVFYHKSAISMGIFKFMKRINLEINAIIIKYKLNEIKIGEINMGIILEKMLNNDTNERYTLKNIIRALSGLPAIDYEEEEAIDYSDEAEEAF